MMAEMAARSAELAANKPVLNSVYFGGGTPSILNKEEWESLWLAINSCFIIDPNAEITVEANPDDLTDEKLRILQKHPTNRLSIGIQSFRDEDLKWMNRAHTADEALLAVDKARSFGFQHFSIDLIYGIPGMNDEAWIQNIEKALALGINHLSAYCLTVEKGTALNKFIETGKSAGTDDTQGANQYRILSELMKDAGFIHYEVSNFARPGHEAVHNSGYWDDMYYLGIGPSAHSYNGKTRSWNVSNNHRYMQGMEANSPELETEICDEINRFNEHLLTGMRRKKGIDTASILDRFNIDLLSTYRTEITSYLQNKWLIQEGTQLCPTEEGFLWSDRMASEMFIIR
jgi:oxygen-independent coproporphyrinogen-3 oxidase